MLLALRQNKQSKSRKHGVIRTVITQKAVHFRKELLLCSNDLSSLWNAVLRLLSTLGDTTKLDIEIADVKKQKYGLCEMQILMNSGKAFLLCSHILRQHKVLCTEMYCLPSAFVHFTRQGNAIYLNRRQQFENALEANKAFAF